MRRLLPLAAVAVAACACGSQAQPTRIVRVAAEVDVSNARDDQSEVAAAASADGQALVAGSNEYRAAKERAYSSVDGGRTWISRLDPPLPHPATGCATDPAVAVDADGFQYYVFLEYRPCDDAGRASLYVATRPHAGAVWLTRPQPIASRSVGEDDHPAVAVDTSPASPNRGRVYIAWARIAQGIAGVVVSHSDDHGRTWSRPATVNDLGANAYDASIATGPRGEVYVSWLDLDSGESLVDVAVDGIKFGSDHISALFHGTFGRDCDVTGAFARAQDYRCVRPNGTLAVDTSTGRSAGRVYFTYSDVTPDRGHDVFVSVLDRRLRGIVGYAANGRGHRVTTPESRSSRADQILPVSAVDPTTGDLWICFYDTAGDITRYTTRFSCVASVDGGRTFTRPFRAASRRSDESTESGNPNQYGDYEGLVVTGGLAHPLWTDTRVSARGDEIFTTTLRLTSHG